MHVKRIYFIVSLLFLLIVTACQQQSEVSEEMDTEDVPSPVELEDGYELTTVTINDSAQINYAPIYFAQTQGYFEEFGIELEVLSFNSVTEAVPLLVAGDLDVYAGSITVGLINILGQEPFVKVVADRGKIIQGGCTFQGILVRKDLYDSGEVNGPEDFAGLTIGATRNATTGFNLYRYIEQAGLTLDDVEIVMMPSSTYIDAFNNKALDAVVTPEHSLTRVLRGGNVVLISKAEDVIGPYQSSVLAFGPRLIKDDPELGARFMAAYLKGVQKYNEGKTQENLQAVSEKTGEDIELLNEACWVPIRLDGFIDYSNVLPFQEWSVEMGHLEATITEEDFWDPSFLEAGFELLNGN